ALMERGAAVLREAGLTPGDRVLLYLEPCPAWPVAFFSILETGLIVVPLPAETPISSAVGVAAFVGARAAIISNRTRGLAAGDGLRCIAIEQVLGSEASVGREVEKEPTHHLTTPPPHHSTTSPDLALLACTSGSTQKPRVVELTHANILANV